MNDPHRDYWLNQAARLRRRVNLAWWLEAMAAPLLVASLAGAAAILWTRREHPVVDPWWLGGGVAAAVLALAAGCWFLARRRFERTEDSLVRLEVAMSLRNSLSTAHAGIGPWPEPAATARSGLSWRWPRLLVPVVGAIALLALGLWIPLTAEPPTASVPDEPQSWQQIADDLDHLAKEEVVDEEYLEETRKKLDELRAQEEEQWFSHSSLEATDSLRETHRAEKERMERELGRAARAMDSLQNGAGATDPAARERMMEEFDRAMEGLRDGTMKPNPGLLDQMRGLDLKQLGQLPPEQMEQLRENLRKHAEAMKAGGEGDDWADELLGDGEGGCDGDGDGNCDQHGDGPGRGGINRGPGHSPDVLGKADDPMKTGKAEGLEATDLSQATPGDLLELQDGEHSVDHTASRISEGGDITATGRGGDRVWRDALDPDEQRAMKRFFD